MNCSSTIHSIHPKFTQITITHCTFRHANFSELFSCWSWAKYVLYYHSVMLTGALCLMYRSLLSNAVCVWVLLCVWGHCLKSPSASADHSSSSINRQRWSITRLLTQSCFVCDCGSAVHATQSQARHNTTTLSDTAVCLWDHHLLVKPRAWIQSTV